MRLETQIYICLVLAIFLAAAPSRMPAQSLLLNMPDDSQRAVIAQRVGLTDITIVYHRPLVNGRKIWGGVVPYDKVWRAGADKNTTIEFTDPVMIEGQPLAKGIYGLHMIPSAGDWTVIFSKNSTSWGSFTYDQSEDALRVTVKPQPAEPHEALTYDFDEVKPDSTVVVLKWEKLSVPFRISVDAQQLTLQKLRDQLRDLPQYIWVSWDDAASYCLDHKIDLEEALRWSDKSIENEERFENLMTKSGLLKLLNRDPDSAAVRAHAYELATATQLYFYGRQLQSQKQPAEALDLFRTAGKRFPEHWVGHLALARVNSAAGDFPNAIKELKAAQAAGLPDRQKSNVERLLHRLEANEDINN